MIVTLDGPAGSGKSTAARKLAARLEIPYLDTGAMYRALAWQANFEEIPLDDADRLVEMARKADLALDCGPSHVRVKVNGRDVTEAIRSLAVAQTTSVLARIQPIREILVEKQREIGRRLGSLVTEGRDQGSVVFPGADVKFVLEADLDRRARRRYDELSADGEEVSIDEVRDALAARDRTDARQWAPLLEPGRALVIDTTGLSIGEVVECLLTHVKDLPQKCQDSLQQNSQG